MEIHVVPVVSVVEEGCLLVALMLHLPPLVPLPPEQLSVVTPQATKKPPTSQLPTEEKRKLNRDWRRHLPMTR